MQQRRNLSQGHHVGSSSACVSAPSTAANCRWCCCGLRNELQRTRKQRLWRRAALVGSERLGLADGRLERRKCPAPIGLGVEADTAGELAQQLQRASQVRRRALGRAAATKALVSLRPIVCSSVQERQAALEQQLERRRAELLAATQAAAVALLGPRRVAAALVHEPEQLRALEHAVQQPARQCVRLGSHVLEALEGRVVVLHAHGRISASTREVSSGTATLQLGASAVQVAQQLVVLNVHKDIVGFGGRLDCSNEIRTFEECYDIGKALARELGSGGHQVVGGVRQCSTSALESRYIAVRLEGREREERHAVGARVAQLVECLHGSRCQRRQFVAVAIRVRPRDGEVESASAQSMIAEQVAQLRCDQERLERTSLKLQRQHTLLGGAA